MAETPRELGYRMPAEWEPHEACWLAWPHLGREWKADLEPARSELLGLCRAIRGEEVRLLVPSAADPVLPGALPSARLFEAPYGDCWTRDTAPIFVRKDAGVAAVCFRFNGWAEKYIMPGDAELARHIAALSGRRRFDADIVLEGGAIDVDGEGTLLTTRSCLLHPRRNPGLDESSTEAALRDALGVETIVWLERGLLNDHTDGHIDTLARFVAPGRVVCMEPRTGDDPNAEVLREIARDLAAQRDARGRRLEVERIPSPGRVEDASGRLMPASYCNFYVANESVVVPTYGTSHDDEAVARVAELFPGRATVGLPAKALLTGGGAFHCVTQQQPRGGG
jgi:agmatine deiminase